jgi:mannose-1-phosphate guanylyltransferase/mannose-6-phosphate isomerase
VPLAAGWSDVGAWDALWQAIAHDGDDNAVTGDVWCEDSTGNLVMAEHRLVACIGCEDMVVVETADAVLVAPKQRTQEVKTIVGRLKAAGRSEAELHRKVHRPWGWYDSIDSGERFQVKRIVVRPGATLSLQMHHHRAEHWVVVKARPKSRAARRSSCSARTSRPTSRSASPTASRTPGRSRSKSSRCNRAAIWARTTSSDSKTPTDAST